MREAALSFPVPRCFCLCLLSITRTCVFCGLCILCMPVCACVSLCQSVCHGVTQDFRRGVSHACFRHMPAPVNRQEAISYYFGECSVTRTSDSCDANAQHMVEGAAGCQQQRAAHTLPKQISGGMYNGVFAVPNHCKKEPPDGREPHKSNKQNNVLTDSSVTPQLRVSIYRNIVPS